jgi:hypothetical protein
MRAVSSSALDLKVLEIDDFALDALESARSKLSKTTPHAVDDVASAGLHWLSGCLVQTRSRLSPGLRRAAMRHFCFGVCHS